MKIDSMGNEEWQQFYGGSLDDFGSWVIPTNDNSFLVAGNSNSVDGDITNYRGAQDFWITKLLPPSVGIQEQGITTFSQLNTSMIDQNLSINFENKLSEEISITLTDLLGRTCFATKVKTAQGKNQFDFRVNLPTEIYLLQLQSKSGLLTRRIY